MEYFDMLTTDLFFHRLREVVCNPMARHQRVFTASLYLRNLPADIDSEELKPIFGKYGSIKDIYIPLDYHTRRPRGFAYVQYRDPYDAEEAMHHLAPGLRLHGHEISIEFAKSERKTPYEMRHRDRGERDDRAYFEAEYYSRVREPEYRGMRTRIPYYRPHDRDYDYRAYERRPREYYEDPRYQNGYIYEEDRSRFRSMGQQQYARLDYRPAWQSSSKSWSKAVRHPSRSRSRSRSRSSRRSLSPDDGRPDNRSDVPESSRKSNSNPARRDFGSDSASPELQ